MNKLDIGGHKNEEEAVVSWPDQSAASPASAGEGI